ncbi:MAG TPA: hypothetical protein VHN99_04560 [Deinococcales bacterium]|nr:hypothetical protein [Deinococcales bacterium]
MIEGIQRNGLGFALDGASDDGRGVDLQDTAQRLAELEEETANLRSELNEAHRELSRLRDEDAARREVQALQADLDALRHRINHPGFWRADFAAAFDEDVEALQDIHEALQGDGPAAILPAFKAWHAEIERGVERLLQEGPYDASLNRQLRRILLEQWVYLRWVEVMDFVSRS